MRASDIDWREVMNTWDESDLLYVRGIIEEKLAQIARLPKRKILITKHNR
jgi:hypothetical protein